MNDQGGKEPHPLDVVPPARIALLVEQVGIRKAAMGLVPTFTLALLAGVFIGFGGMLFTAVVTGSELGFGPTRLLGGAAFSLGLVLVIVGGAELFTGNSLLVIAWADGRIRLAALARNWTIVYAGNLIGALALVAMAHGAGLPGPQDSAVAETARAIALGKAALAPHEAFIRAVLCNMLVCLAVWMCFAAHRVTGKILVILFPITAFVALGFEHSVANMYLMPIGMLAGASVTAGDLIANLVVVTLGNIVGGGVLVAGVYWLIYRRQGS